MDFNDTAEQAQFRTEIRDWLQANGKPKAVGAFKPLKPAGSEGTVTHVEAQAWYKKKADAGYACLTWPKEYGGAGLSPSHQVIWNQEIENYRDPDSYFFIGQGNCGPALMNFANEETKCELMPRMASAEDIWCQLFSEPGAGSDVAGLSTKAVKDGDNWAVNGQKIWTSGAQYSRYGVILTRTDPTISKYRGMTMFMIDMEQAGVEVQPIKQMDEGRHFNEVFFNDAIIPDHYRLGEVGGGWGCAITILMHERLGVSGVQPTGFPEFLATCKTLEINGEAIINDPVVRERLATWYSQYAGIKNATNRMFSAVSKGGMPGAEASLGKLVGASMSQEISNFMCQQLGHSGIMMQQPYAESEAHFQNSLLLAPGIRLAGGTDEVMRNIIAEQVLGLPQETRADKGMAYQDIPSGNTTKTSPEQQ
ncbi:MAG: acyl-CoA dehydrogenase family protein [Pseudomonadales bacterium]